MPLPSNWVTIFHAEVIVTFKVDQVRGRKNSKSLYLDDLRDKTHRGLAGCATRGWSAGGRIFGYRTVPVEVARRGAKHTAPARFEIEPQEAKIVRRIFRGYAAGQSMQAIAFALNRDGVHFPAQETQRGPHRRGWAVSAVRVILRNEKYAGVWVWNKRRFIKDPDTGRRRALPRPPEEWIRQEDAALLMDQVTDGATVPQRRGDTQVFGCFLVQESLDVAGLLVGEESARTEGTPGPLMWQRVESVGCVGRPPAADSLPRDAEQVGQVLLRHREIKDEAARIAHAELRAHLD